MVDSLIRNLVKKSLVGFEITTDNTRVFEGESYDNRFGFSHRRGAHVVLCWDNVAEESAVLTIYRSEQFLSDPNNFKKWK